MSAATRISIADYERLIEQLESASSADQRFELIRGEVRPMSPIGSEHAYVLMVLDRWSHSVLPPEGPWILVQGPLELTLNDSIPQPDLAWIKSADRHHRATAEDVLLVIEVSKSTLAQDRGEKASLYAEARISEYWIVNLIDRCIEVHRDPEGNGYRTRTVFVPGDEVHPLAFPEIALPVATLFESGR